jgi:hypothetical protein
VTSTTTPGIDRVSKLNPAGDNIFADGRLENMVWGAPVDLYKFNQPFRSQFIDIAVDYKGDIFLLCQFTGQIFQYTKEGQLLFIFGGKGTQKGTFDIPSSLKVFNNDVYVLDSTKNSITVFRLTEFGHLVATAMDLFEQGDYAASLEPWQEVMRRDSNYYMASIGMGNAKLSINEFEAAMDFFYQRSLGGYNRAFRDFRTEYIRDNFNMFIVIALVAVVGLIGLSFGLKVAKKRRGR